jgi:threonine/homoserine/homoserine lactone efflux protein
MMFGIHEIWLFIASGLLLNVTPGPDTAYIVGRSIQLGWRGGVVAVLGIEAGCLLHVFAATIGLSALLAASSVAFNLVKWAGAAYLCFVGVKMLLAPAPTPVTAAANGTGAISLRRISLRQVFLQGALTNALNPKVALFFLAFLPQFVTTDSPHKAAAFALLGLIFIFNGTLWCLGVAVFAAGAAGRIRKSAQAFAWINRGLGGLFVYLGVRVAMAETR